MKGKTTFLIAFSTILVLKVFAQNSKWQNGLSLSPSISPMTVESNAGFDYVGREDQEMPYGIIPKRFTIFKSYLQWGVSANYWIQNSKGLVFKTGLSLNYSVFPEQDGNVNFQEPNINFQFYSLDFSVGYDFLPKKLDEDLFVLISTGLVYNRNVTEHISEPKGFPSVPFQEFGQEKFVRKGFSMGWSSSLHWVDYFSTHWGYSVFAEYSATRVEPSKMRMTEFHVNGVDELNTLTTRQKEYEFGDVADDDPLNPDKPKILPTEFYDYAFFTIGVGVHYRF